MGVDPGGFVGEKSKFMVVWKESIGVGDSISTEVLKSSSEVGLLGAGATARQRTHYLEDTLGTGKPREHWWNL